jgi:predicted nucleic acid-binding protein
MAVVVDASLAVKWAVTEDDSETALGLLDLWQEWGERLVAPPLYRPEVTNVLFQKFRRGELDRDDAAEMNVALLSLVAVLEPPRIYSRALALAREFNLTATYDSLYLALAESEGYEMWTADRRFVRSVQARFDRVRWIGEHR